METIKKGFNVLIEKPAGMNSKEVKELIKAKNKSNVQVSVGLQKKYSNVFTKAKEYINSNGGINSIVINAPERFEEIKSKKKYTKKVLSNWIISNGIHKDEIKEKGIEKVAKSYEAICNYIQSELKW